MNARELRTEANHLEFYSRHFNKIMSSPAPVVIDGEDYDLTALKHNIKRAVETLRLAAEKWEQDHHDECVADSTRGQVDQTRSTVEGPFITTAQVRATDLRSDDIADVRFSHEKSRWRAVFDVYRDAGDVLVELDEVTSDEIIEKATEINLTPESQMTHGVLKLPAPRPGVDPLIIIPADEDFNGYGSRDHLRRIEPRVLTYALLETGKYVAVRFVREETDDGSQTEHGWMIAPWWYPVTIQVKVNPQESA